MFNKDRQDPDIDEFVIKRLVRAKTWKLPDSLTINDFDEHYVEFIAIGYHPCYLFNRTMLRLAIRIQMKVLSTSESFWKLA